MACQNFLQPLEIPLWRSNNTCIALNWLRNQSCWLTTGGSANQIIYRVCTGIITLWEFLPQRTAIAISIRCKMNTATRMWICTPHLNTSQAHGQFGATVQAIPQGNKFILASVYGSQQQSSLISLSTSRAEKSLLQIPRSYLCQLFCQINKILCKVSIAYMLQTLHLLYYLCIYLRVAVTAVNNGNTGKAIQILPSFTIKEILHFTLDELSRLLVKMSQARHNILFLFLQNGLRANRLLQRHNKLSYYPLF